MLTEHRNQGDKTDLMIVTKKKENLPKKGFSVPVDEHSENERKPKKEKNSWTLPEKQKKIVKHEVDNDTICNW